MNPNPNPNPNRSGPLYRPQRRKSDALANPPIPKARLKNVAAAQKTLEEFSAANSQVTGSRTPRDGDKPRGSQKGSLCTSLASSRNKDREEPKLVQFKDRRSAPHSKEPIQRLRLQRSPVSTAPRGSDANEQTSKRSLPGTPRRGESKSPTDVRGPSTPDGSPGRTKRLKRLLSLTLNTSPRGRAHSKADAEPGPLQERPSGDKSPQRPHPLVRDSSPSQSPTRLNNLKFLEGLNKAVQSRSGRAEPLPELPLELPQSKIQRLKEKNQQLGAAVVQLQREVVELNQLVETLLVENRNLKELTSKGDRVPSGGLPPADQL